MQEIELIKKIYNNADNDVIILDYNLKCIWHNNQKIVNQFSEDTYKSLFENNLKEDTKNGSYYFEWNNQRYLYTLKNIPDILKGIYIIEFLNYDVTTTFFQNKNMGNMIENHIAAIRQSIFGITNVNQALYYILEKMTYIKIYNILIPHKADVVR